ncbi:MAG: hypothetical protein N2053_06060 [Chitinispirillaceae bacterium]|nr:hypothetical protein [Chitinispirillaceae bacterium]
MKKKMVVTIISTIVFMGVTTTFADLSIKADAVAELTKKCKDATTGKVDDSWARAEVKFLGNIPNTGLSGLIHLRVQPQMGAGVTGIHLQPRQIYFKIPVVDFGGTLNLEIIGGRWYEVYGPGYFYFGRYLVESNELGNGSMNTNYTILDGFKGLININPIKSTLQVGVLPKVYNFEDTYLLTMFGGNITEAWKYNIGGNFEIIKPEGKDAVNRASINSGYTFVKDLNLARFGEMAIVNLNKPVDNMWFLVGFSSKVWYILDRLQVELEIKNHRAGATTTDNNLAWMLLLRKGFKGLTFDMNIGADPKVLGSKKISDVGGIFRMTASF